MPIRGAGFYTGSVFKDRAMTTYAKPFAVVSSTAHMFQARRHTEKDEEVGAFSNAATRPTRKE